MSASDATAPAAFSTANLARWQWLLQRATSILEAVQKVPDDLPAMVLCVRLAAVLTAQSLDGGTRPDKTIRTPIPIDAVLVQCKIDLPHLQEQTEAADWALSNLRNVAYVKAG